MKKKHIYKAIDVEKLDTLSVVSLLTVGCIISIDVAKSKFVAAIATGTGEVLRLVRFEHPRQSGAFLRLLAALRDARLEPHVVMEPTGTYGDAIRYQCQRLGIPVHMMSPKHTHDFSEVLDGVPSMHDPKAAMALARLQAIRPARRGAVGEAPPPRYLLHDRDCIYDGRFRARLRGLGVRCLRSPPRAPKANAICERMVGTLRRDCLDHTLVFSERHAERVLREYVRYYHGRPHRSLRAQPPAGAHWLAPARPAASRELLATPILGGLHHQYAFRAARTRSQV